MGLLRYRLEKAVRKNSEAHPKAGIFPLAFAGGNEQIRARGGYTVDMKWCDGRVTFLRISAIENGYLAIVNVGTEKIVHLKAGKTKRII